jgi:hypothetical protein
LRYQSFLKFETKILSELKGARVEEPAAILGGLFLVALKGLAQEGILNFL